MVEAEGQLCTIMKDKQRGGEGKRESWGRCTCVQTSSNQWEVSCCIWPTGAEFSLMVVLGVYARLHISFPPMAFHAIGLS